MHRFTLRCRHNCYVSSCRAFSIRLRTLDPSWQTECNARDHMVEYLDWCSRPPVELRRSPTDLADEEEGVHQPLPPPPQRVSGDFPVAHHPVLLQVPTCRREQQKYNEITRHACSGVGLSMGAQRHPKVGTLAVAACKAHSG